MFFLFLLYIKPAASPTKGQSFLLVKSPDKACCLTSKHVQEKKTKMLKSLSKFHLFKLHESDTFLPKPPTLSACANLAMNCSRKNLQDGNAVRQRRGVVTHTTRPVYCRYIKTVYEGLQVIEKQKQPKSHP